ncbi:unnamed protein product [Fusarium graminearum]|uniref:Chromosome 3, complete genome n=1 Tax=Gibberella zeae (strain ATCC MYA-4620 / CBS 123657 / FGSC 9075 / NRRL 31084 / PH-1) TaxID=229533 RepID=A0A0E0SQQ7_GIBZE|nr:hypothetical protein FG05_30025 [Fusarium graminearum]CEF88770.1 unnamed protein product [Fusarium graminearum]CZS85308.1 unnamed protein product [Fusarium graminearum]
MVAMGWDETLTYDRKKGRRLNRDVEGGGSSAEDGGCDVGRGRNWHVVVQTSRQDKAKQRQDKTWRYD